MSGISLGTLKNHFISPQNNHMSYYDPHFSVKRTKKIRLRMDRISDQARTLNTNRLNCRTPKGGRTAWLFQFSPCSLRRDQTSLQTLTLPSKVTQTWSDLSPTCHLKKLIEQVITPLSILLPPLNFSFMTNFSYCLLNVCLCQGLDRHWEC